jgi:UMF1 family MFS transporter
MSGVPPPTRAIPRSAVASWVVYDLANTIFSMGVLSASFPHFVGMSVGATRADRVWGLIQSISYAIIFVISPLLGAMTDRASRRMPFLVWSTIVCVVCTALLAKGPFLLSAALVIVANAAYQAGLQFYDSLLVEVSTEENRGRVSGIGVGIGYIGSYIAIGLGLWLGDDFGTLFVLIAAAYLLLALPCFFWVRERGNPRPRPVFQWAAIRESARETIATLRSTAEYPGLARFLIGRVFYTDAINTVIGFMALYALNIGAAAGLTPDESQFRKDIVFIVAITCAVASGFVWGRLTDRIGPKRTLTIVLRLWMATFAFAAAAGAFTLPPATLFVVASMVGIAMAGTWVADRPLMLRLTPAHRIGEFYGLYGMVGRFSAITGPFVWAATTYVLVERSGLDVLTGEAAAILVLLLMIVISYRILGPVSDRR